MLAGKNAPARRAKAKKWRFCVKKVGNKEKLMEKLKENRVASFIVVAVVYIIAAAVGIAVFRAVRLRWWVSLLIADAIATVVVFIFSVIFGNASVYDPYWSVQPPVILFCFAIGKNITPLGVLILIAVTFWAVRLTVNWAYTFSNLKHQDWRYTMLKEKTGAFYPVINLLGIHMFPTLVVYFCTIPAAYAILHNLPLTVGGVCFICLSVGAAVLQGTADIQMHKYRKNRTTAFIRTGLWKYSRHPNYLGEILMWWGIALAVICSVPSVWYSAVGAFINTVMFLVVSIPMADGRQSRKDGFEEYKRQTRMLLPIKKKI